MLVIFSHSVWGQFATAVFCMKMHQNDSWISLMFCFALFRCFGYYCHAGFENRIGNRKGLCKDSLLESWRRVLLEFYRQQEAFVCLLVFVFKPCWPCFQPLWRGLPNSFPQILFLFTLSSVAYPFPHTPPTLGFSIFGSLEGYNCSSFMAGWLRRQ